MQKFIATVLAITLATALAAPAHANWETTLWGMSPDEALAALDGASTHDPAPSEIYEAGGSSYAPRVRMPFVVEGVAGQASLLFDTADRLHFVLFNPDDIAECDTLSTALTERHGAGGVLESGSIAISDWVADGNAIKLTKTPTICNLSYSRQ